MWEGDLSDGEAEGKAGMRGLRTNLVVELWQLHLHFLSLKQVVLSLFTHWRDQIELSGHGVGLLGWGGEEMGVRALLPLSSTPPPPAEWVWEWSCERW